MKRAISFLLVLVMCLSLCACGKSQSVKDVENAIKAIGEVSLDSNDAILKAERLYDNLTDSEKSEVENKAALVEARFTYDRFYNDKVYDIAKETYDVLSEVAKLYYFEAANVQAVGELAKSKKMLITDTDFCKTLAEATSSYRNIPSFTEEEVQQGLKNYLEEEWATKEPEATSTVCINVILSTLYSVRGDYEKPKVEKAGALLLELSDTFHDEKYYPVLIEYRDFVATGDLILSNMKRLDDLRDSRQNYQAQNGQLSMKIEPLFAK